MRQGEGNFSVHMIFLPAITYAFTDNFSILAGMSLIPDASSQLKYIAPKIGTSLSDNAAVSVGTMYLTVSGDEGGGFVFGSTTLGPRDRSFSASIAVPYATEGGFADGAIVTLGGNVRMSNSASFITENWLLFGEGESEQLFSAGIRWFGDRIAVDFVAIIVPDADKPFPWLSFTYNFGR